MIVWVARMMDFRPEAQTLLTVVQTVESGRPAPMAHCRAGFWPRLDGSVNVWGESGSQDLGLLCREYIAKEDFLDVFSLDRWDPLEGSYIHAVSIGW